MLVLIWISLFGFFCSGTGVDHHTRHGRTRYVSSKNQIYGGDFDFSEKYIPFVHFWEKPLQILENSMKIPKKLSSRPLFSWDIPVPITTNIPSGKISTPENPTKTEKFLKVPKLSDTDINVQKNIHKSRSDRAKASLMFPDSFALIPIKKKKSGNRKKSVEELETLRAFSENNKTFMKADPKGRLKKKKKARKNRKRKLEGTGKRRKTIGRTKEMNDQVHEVGLKVPKYLERNSVILVASEVKSPCEMQQEKCEYQCSEVNGKAVCVCYRGFTFDGNKCIDINECETDNGGCNGKCINTIGSRKCICSEGFRLVDGVCADINECLLRNGHGPCQDQCTNTIGSYYCTCDGLSGKALSSDKHTCEDNQRCNVTLAGCSHSCINLSGRTFCTCPDGLELRDDWKTCQDIDECSNPEDYDVHCESECVNTLGSYSCVTPTETSSSAYGNRFGDQTQGFVQALGEKD